MYVCMCVCVYVCMYIPAARCEQLKHYSNPQLLSVVDVSVCACVCLCFCVYVCVRVRVCAKDMSNGVTIRIQENVVPSVCVCVCV